MLIRKKLWLNVPCIKKTKQNIVLKEKELLPLLTEIINEQK
jgi:hypothetical protein